jgi:hypothetical protein
MQMTRKGTYFSVKLVLIVVLLVTLFAFSGCSGVSEGYRQFILREGSVHFSFEYPVSFDKPEVQIYEGQPWVGSRRTTEEEEWYAIFAVDAVEPGHVLPDAKTAANYFLESLEGGNGRVLLERSSVTIDGVAGELFIVSCAQWLADDFYRGISQGIPALVRQVFFDHKDLIWDITFISHVDRAEEDEAHFKHLLETFKFLK